MTVHELKLQIADLQKRSNLIKTKVDPDKLQTELDELEKQIQSTDFWNNQENAQKVSQRAGDLRKEIEQIGSLQMTVEAINEYFEEGILEDGSDLATMVEEELASLERQVNIIELATFLSGKFDANDCLFTIKAGQGGTEAMDWTDILMRMYTRYFNSKGWNVEIIDTVPGTEAGYQTVEMKVVGRNAYGYLKHEHGTHRLVRNSPFNSAGLRQTSFAGVEVTPIVEEDIDIEIKDEDIEFTAVRSSGAGGQSVNKTSSKARIVHKPTGIAVESSVHRKQHQNKEEAMRMLKAKLFLIEEEKRKNELSNEKGEYKKASWGNQIRNYVFSPYKLVKDLRTQVETSQIDSVMDGELDEFIEAEVRML